MVTIPTPFLTWTVLVNGTMVVAAVPHTTSPAPDGIVNVNCWLLLNGWFGIKIPLAGTSITLDLSPNVNDLPKLTGSPTVNAIPICSWGLKNILSFLLDTNSPISSLSKLIICGIVSTNPPRTWDDVFADPTTPLLTLKILLSSKIFKTRNLSVPIPILLPTDTDLGILAK